MDDAIAQAIDRCVKEGRLVQYFTSQRSEVMEMMLVEQTAERAVELMQLNFERQGMEKGLEQGMEKGLEQGMQQGEANATLKIAAGLVRDGILTVEQVCERYNLDAAAVEGVVAEG